MDNKKAEVVLVHSEVLNSLSTHNVLKDIYIADTGASSHMTCTKQGMINVRKSEITIQMGNGERLQCNHIGNIPIAATQKNKRAYDVVFKDFLYIPQLELKMFALCKTLKKG